jgi:DNA helicase HerA-like ATPase
MADIGSDADGPFVVCPEMNKALFQLNSFSCSKVLSRENIDELLFDVGLSGIAGRKRARLVEALRLLLFKNLYPRSKALIARERKLKFNEDALSLRSLTFSRFSSTLKLLLVGLLKTLSELNNVIVEIINYMDGSKPLEDIRYPGTKENPEFGDKL